MIGRQVFNSLDKTPPAPDRARKRSCLDSHSGNSTPHAKAIHQSADSDCEEGDKESESSVSVSFVCFINVTTWGKY
jgi:hypothetical protein